MKIVQINILANLLFIFNVRLSAPCFADTLSARIEQDDVVQPYRHRQRQ